MNVSSESILAGEIMCSSSGSRRFVSAATASVALLAIGVIGLSKDGPVRSEPAGKIPAQPQFVDDQASPAALKSLADRLTVQLKKDCPQAEVLVDGHELKVRYLVRKFMVHGHYKTGEFSDEARQEEGPRYRGFLLHAYFHSENPVSALEVPCELHEPYWTSYVNHYAIGKGKDAGFATVRLSYNRGTDPELLKTLKALCAADQQPNR